MTTPSTDDIRRSGNHLRGERSLYLEQHAHNPIDWYPWGDEALSRAKSEDRPIFLSVGYSSCHWCHVMEEQVFEDDAIAAYMNEHFVSIKVDREERPDLDAVYMKAVQALSGSGGWPMSVFLTPDLEPFFGGTYFPPETFMELARAVTRAFESRRDEVERSSARLREAVTLPPRLGEETDIADMDLDRAAAEAVTHFDEEWGGFSAQMKFPTPVRWLYVLHRQRHTGSERLERVLRGTLDHMGSGGIHDHVGGGFHRYTTERTWLVPHFEKMLYDNALIATLYTEAAVAFDDPRYGEIARDTLSFLSREMWDPEGGFCASFDADSGGEEGSFYVWTPAELEQIAGPEDGRALALLLGVTDRGNFEGRSILTRRASPEAIARETGRPTEEIASLLRRHLDALRAHRARRPAPTLDRKVVTAWNALAISAFARASLAFDEPDWAAVAERAASLVLERHGRPDGSLARASTAGGVSGDGTLEDHSVMADALVDLHQATGDPAHLAGAVDLVEHVRARYRSPTGYYMTPDDRPQPLGRQEDPYDSVTPSGIASMLRASLRLSSISGRPDLRDEVASILSAHASVMRRAKLDMAWWWDVAQMLAHPTRCEGEACSIRDVDPDPFFASLPPAPDS